MNDVVALDALESESVEILREAAAVAGRPILLYSIGKDSPVLLHLARKALSGAAALPLGTAPPHGGWDRPVVCGPPKLAVSGLHLRSRLIDWPIVARLWAGSLPHVAGDGGVDGQSAGGPARRSHRAGRDRR